MQIGDTYLDDADPDGHIYIVASDPRRDPDHVVVVNLSSLKPRSDTTCVLNPGDHVWVRHPTVAYYRMARLRSLDDLESRRTAGTLRLQRRLSPGVLRRIQEGFGSSDQAPMDCFEVLRAQGYC